MVHWEQMGQFNLVAISSGRHPLQGYHFAFNTSYSTEVLLSDVLNFQFYEIKIRDDGFSQEAVQISRGDIVIWRWNNAQHVIKLEQVMLV